MVSNNKIDRHAKKLRAADPSLNLRAARAQARAELACGERPPRPADTLQASVVGERTRAALADARVLLDGERGVIAVLDGVDDRVARRDAEMQLLAVLYLGDGDPVPRVELATLAGASFDAAERNAAAAVERARSVGGVLVVSCAGAARGFSGREHFASLALQTLLVEAGFYQVSLVFSAPSPDIEALVEMNDTVRTQVRARVTVEPFEREELMVRAESVLDDGGKYFTSVGRALLRAILGTAPDGRWTADAVEEISTALVRSTPGSDVGAREVEAAARDLAHRRWWPDFVMPNGVPPRERAMTVLEALGYDDPAESLSARWKRHDRDRQLVMQVGWEMDWEKNPAMPVSVLVGRPSLGGDGTVGLLQGVTGAGKSFILVACVLGLATRYSPERLQIIALDEKGAGLYQAVAGLPHVQAGGDWGAQTEGVERAEQVIAHLVEEIRLRRAAIEAAGCVDLADYRRARSTDASLAPIADLLVVWDEMRELFSAHRGVRDAVANVAAAGARVGISLLLSSQIMEDVDARLTGLTYGISLRAANAGSSVAVLGSPAAVDLSIGTGAGYLRRATSDRLTSILGFNLYEASGEDERTAQQVLTQALSGPVS